MLSNGERDGRERKQRLIIECVPNFSEGRDPVIVASLGQRGFLGARRVASRHHVRSRPQPLRAHFCRSTAGGCRRGVCRRYATLSKDRPVAGTPACIPGWGSADVCRWCRLPASPWSNAPDLRAELGARIWDELRVPVYLYEAAALRPECRRSGECAQTGARGACARSWRRAAPHGRRERRGSPQVSDRLEHQSANDGIGAWRARLRARSANHPEASRGKSIGLPLESRGQVQVSINLVDFEITPLYVVFEAVRHLCEERGIEIAGSELIGMIPAAALESSHGHDLQWENLRPELILENRLREAGLLL